MVTTINQVSDASLTDLREVFKDAGMSTPCPTEKLGAWKLFISGKSQDGQEHVYEVDMAKLAGSIDLIDLAAFFVSGYSPDQKPGQNGGVVLGMYPGGNYQTAWTFEPYGGGVGIVLWTVHKGMVYAASMMKQRNLINDPETASFGTLREFVRGFNPQGMNRAEAGMMELTEEAGTLLKGKIVLKYLGTGNPNTARHHCKPDLESGFMYLEAEIDPNLIEETDRGYLRFKSEVFSESPEKESKTFEPLQFWPLFGADSALDQVKYGTPLDHFTSTGTALLIHRLYEANRLTVNAK